MLGAAEFAKGEPDHLAKLRNQVTSPGGTSAAAQYQLERGRLRTVLIGRGLGRLPTLPAARWRR